MTKQNKSLSTAIKQDLSLNPQQILLIKKLLHNKSISLVGLMAAGKTTIGKIIAAKLGFKFYDSDYEIEKSASISINDLFELYGEKEFRLLETRVIKRLFEEESIILSTGGGAFVNKESKKIIAQNSITIWLDTELAILTKRLSNGKTRPLLTGKNHEIIINNLSRTREKSYVQADIRVKCGDETKQKVAAKVLMTLLQYLQNDISQ